MATRRQRRVSQLIHREMSMLLMREVRDPRLADITITEVRVTPDLLIARIYYTVLGDAEQEKEAATALESALGYLRTQLAGRVRLRLAPELVFELDQSAKYGRHIDELLDQIAASSQDQDEDGDGDGSASA
ncbi:MAG: 30S ribosome-binding factor RbfA [Anaerolineae bacterium]